MRINKRSLLGAAITAALAGLTVANAGTAQAAVGDVWLDGTVVRYQGSTSDNNVIVTHQGNSIVFEDSAVMIPGAACWYPDPANVFEVACPDAGITSVNVKAGGGEDRIVSSLSPFGSLVSTTMWGEDGDDLLIGGFGNDVLRGGAGKDDMWGRQGRDGVTYYGYSDDVYADIDDGTGDDGSIGEGDTIHDDVEDLYGGEGSDWLRGDAKDNYLHGNGGDDEILGMEGQDTIHGGKGEDDLFGESATVDSPGTGTKDYIYGDEGNDLIEGGYGNDELYGGSEVDWIYGGHAQFCGACDETGNDKIVGGAGNDYLFGMRGMDYLLGEADNDQLYGGGDSEIMLDGGSGSDKCDDVVGTPKANCES